MSVQPVPERLRYMNPPGRVDTSNMTTRERIDAKSGIELVEGVVTFLADTYPGLRESLVARADQGDAVAGMFLERLDLGLSNLADLAIMNGTDQS